MYIKIILVVIILTSIGCAAQRPILPVGEVPKQGIVENADEQYGHRVLAELTQQFPLSHDDQAIDRVRKIVDRLSVAAQASQNPWHVYVLHDPKFKNAAATRGNYIFVWTAMIDAAKSDEDLATVLAHEIGHVLAGHTAPDPAEEVTQILAGVLGRAAGTAIYSQGYAGVAAGITEAIVGEVVKGVALNPSLQSKELEADQVGLFLMADAGYNPEAAVNFWERAESDPDLATGNLVFMSTHPSNVERVQRLKSFLPEAIARYRGEKKPVIRNASTSPIRSVGVESYQVIGDWASIYSSPDRTSDVVIDLPGNSKVLAKESDNPRWLQVFSPVHGFGLSRDFTPLP